MKLSGYILIVVLIGLIFAIIGSIIHDLESQYPNVNVNTSWEEEYDYSSQIDTATQGLKSKFEIIGDQERGWFSRLTAGITAIPTALVEIPSVIFLTISYAYTTITDLGSKIGIPPFVITISLISLVILIVFALVSFWHRQKA